jgi:hypothetical protein
LRFLTVEVPAGGFGLGPVGAGTAWLVLATGGTVQVRPD